MPPEDLNTGPSADSPEIPTADVAPETSTAQPDETQGSPEVVHDTTPINPISDVLKAFESELNGVTAPNAPQNPATVPPPTVPGQPAAPKLSRDYSGLEPDEVEMFKQMSNRAYNGMYKRWLDAKKAIAEREDLRRQLEEQRSVHFYEQEGAWTLSPEYQQLSQGREQLSREANFWQQQLENLEAGNEWSDLMLDANGRVVVGPPQPPSPQGKARVMSGLTQAHTMLNSLGSQISSFEQNFKSKHQSFASKLTQLEAQVLGGAENIKKLDAHIGKKLELFPAHMRGRQEIRSFARALLVIDGLTNLLRQAKGQATSAAIKTQTARSAGPTGASGGAGGAAPQTVGAIYDEFKRAKMGAI